MKGANALGRTDDQDMSPADKETGLHHTGDEIQRCFQFTRPLDAFDVDINDEMTILSLKRNSVALS